MVTTGEGTTLACAPLCPSTVSRTPPGMPNAPVKVRRSPIAARRYGGVTG
jgi:hypothetical protein